MWYNLLFFYWEYKKKTRYNKPCVKKEKYFFFLKLSIYVEQTAKPSTRKYSPAKNLWLIQAEYGGK